MIKQIVVVAKILKGFNNMRNFKNYFIFFILIVSCEYEKPAYKFSNYYGTVAENMAKAIEDENIEIIKDEIIKEKVSIDFKDKKYEVSLLTLAIVNHKKKAFEELLELGANPNINNSYCVSPLISAIRNNKNCNLYYVERLLESGASITPRFFDKCNYFSYDPISETIQHYSDEEEVDCGLKILKLLTSKFNNPNLLFMYNNSQNYEANVVYLCLSTHKNISALKYLIVDLGYKVPEKIFIDGTVLLNQKGFKSLQDILQDDQFIFSHSKLRDRAKKDILSYLNKRN